MDTDNSLHQIKTIVTSFLPDAKVLLFGSRARGNNHPHSDYDVMIITEENYPPHEKIVWESKISKALVYSLNAPFDVFLQSQTDIEKKKNSTGYIIYHALKDAVEL